MREVCARKRASPSTATRSMPPRVWVASCCSQCPMSGAGTTTSVAGDRNTFVGAAAGPAVGDASLEKEGLMLISFGVELPSCSPCCQKIRQDTVLTDDWCETLWGQTPSSRPGSRFLSCIHCGLRRTATLTIGALRPGSRPAQSMLMNCNKPAYVLHPPAVSACRSAVVSSRRLASASGCTQRCGSCIVGDGGEHPASCEFWQ